MELLNTGLGNYVSASRVVAIVNPESAPIKRLIQDAKDSGTAIDATFGRRTRAVIIMDSGQIVLSPQIPETIVDRSNKSKKTKADTPVEE
jgi:regulator of extracellular matrix RemA (YlzA/DUF370 family)